ncbi:MAG: hypothetical protein CBB72_000700 [Muricauda sp. TMED12]|nr:MAG: hypothetical protein CBB72_000700 [Muricauda sp. TMED12]
MKQLTFIIGCILVITVAKAQDQRKPNDSIKVLVDSTFTLFEEHSLYSSQMDWIKRKKAFYRQAKAAHTFSEVFPMFQTIFDELQDHHSFFWFNNQKYASNYGQLDESNIRKPLMEAMEKGEAIHTVKLLGDIGYIRISQDNTSDDFGDMQKAAQQIQDMICEIHRPDIKGWILDLRLNSGGNMYPMLSGISSFLEDGTFAITIDRKNHRKSWSLSGKAIYEGEKKITELQLQCLPEMTDKKIAVLTSQVTGSSGEITALALRNRDNTIFIGEKTAGFMTSNELFRLPFNTFLLLTYAEIADNNGIVYKYIEPDIEIIEGDNFNELTKDKKIQTAINWINHE